MRTVKATTPDGNTRTRGSRTRVYTHARWIQFPGREKQTIVSFHASEELARRAPAGAWSGLSWGVVPVEVVA